jgi:NADP-dependent 3-hydroxy acid dehydrogenase YdfG
LDFSGKVVFISGGSSGIGEELCHKMIQFGAKKVIIAARTMSELERVKSQSGAPDRVMVYHLDLN